MCKYECWLCFYTRTFFAKQRRLSFSELASVVCTLITPGHSQKCTKELSVVCTLITPGHSQKCTTKIFFHPDFLIFRVWGVGCRFGVMWSGISYYTRAFTKKVHKNGMTLHPGLFRVRACNGASEKRVWYLILHPGLFRKVHKMNTRDLSWRNVQVRSVVFRIPPGPLQSANERGTFLCNCTRTFPCRKVFCLGGTRWKRVVLIITSGP